MNAALKQQIIDNMSNVTHSGITGESIRLFAQTAHLKESQEVAEMVDAIQSQIVDSPDLMKTILGNRYPFFLALKIKATV